MDKDSKSENRGSIRWVPMLGRFPDVGQVVLVYRPKGNPQVMFQTVCFMLGDEESFTHWAELTAPEWWGQ